MGTDTTIETEPLSVTNPTKEKGKEKVDKKAKGAAQAEAGTDRILRPVATATFLGTMPETAKEDRTMKKKKQEKTPNKRGKEARNHLQIADELDLEFAQHVSYVEPTTPVEKPMITSTRTDESING